MTVHDFGERLAFSQGVVPDDALLRRLCELVPSAIGTRAATKQEDRSGTDVWIERRGLPALSVDFKHRDYCPIDRFRSDDACVETCSVYRGQTQPWRDDLREVVGWTINPAKRTDYVVYTWPSKHGRRYWILSFPLLCRTSQIHWREWAVQFGERAAVNAGYRTLSVYPPRLTIAAAMRAISEGVAA